MSDQRTYELFMKAVKEKKIDPEKLNFFNLLPIWYDFFKEQDKKSSSH
jgi:hypothetical protein